MRNNLTIHNLKTIVLRGLALPLSLCLFLTAYAQTPRQTDTPLAKETKNSVAALLEQLQPDLMVVDGDPIKTTTLEELMRKHHVPGVSIAVIRDGKIDWARGFGIADVETGRAVTHETLFQAASISKPVAAAAALTMVQDGLLDLDEDVNLKLKSWKVPTNEFTDQQPVTLRQLLFPYRQDQRARTSRLRTRRRVA